MSRFRLKQRNFNRSKMPEPITEEIEKLFLKERTRQESSLNMISASNVVPNYVREALASNFTNVIAEGYRNDRYHTGTENYDDLEILGEELAQKAFKGYHVNLKPHSGTQAVQAAFLAMKAEGRSCVLSMGLKDGGHITHGKITHFNKEIGFKFVHYEHEQNVTWTKRRNYFIRKGVR